MFRILVTGSRDWPSGHVVQEAIISLKEDYPFYWDDVVIVHGDCPTGADAMAQEFCDTFYINFERHPADWSAFGKFAGPKRNQEMVDLGADVVLAFPLANSRGTLGCMKMAKDAGLRVLKVGLDGTITDW